MKYVKIAALAVALAVSATPAFAATLNDGSQDSPMVEVTNVTRNPDSNTNWTTSVSASEGELVAVEVYYHNTSASETANNVVVRLNRPSGNSSSYTLTGSVSADNASQASGNATVNITGGARPLTFFDVIWRPNQTVNGSQTLLYGQMGDEIFTNGLRIGNIGPGWSTQGNVIVRFRVSPPPVVNPSATTNSATDITYNSATLNGNVNANGNTNVNTYFEYGTNNPPTTQTSSQSFGSGTNSITSVVSNLQPSTTYYFRAVAVAGNGQPQYGSVLSFTTAQPPVQNPTVTTNSASNIANTGATLNGFVNPNGNSNVTVWFEWGTDSSVPFSTANQTLGASSVSFLSSLASQLSSGTTYYFRAAVRGVNGQTFRGSVLSFTTTGTRIHGSGGPVYGSAGSL